MRWIGYALRSLVTAFWRAMCWVVWLVRMAILVACNAFWRFLLRRAENAEQVIIRELKEVAKDRKLEAEKKQIEYDKNLSMLRSDLAVVTRERDLLIEVHTRNIERVRAEASIAARTIAESQHSMITQNQGME